MTGKVLSLLLIGLAGAGLRYLVEILIWGRPPGPHRAAPHRTPEIAEEGRRRAEKAQGTRPFYYHSHLSQ